MATVGATFAQDGSGRPARIHIGSFNVSPTLTIQDVGYDSNVYNVEDNPTSDFTFTIVPRFVATAGTPQNSLTVRSATDMVYFSEQQSERSINENLDATTKVTLRRLFLVADGSYINTRQRTNEEIDVRSRRLERRAGLVAGLKLSPKLAVQLGAAYASSAFADDTPYGAALAEQLNQATRTLAAGVRYAATPLTTFSADVALDRTRFPLSPPRDANSLRLVGGVKLQPRALVAGSAEFGIQRFRPLTPILPDFDGFIGSAKLTYRLGGAAELGFQFDRTLASSYLVTDPYYVRTGYGVSVRRQLVPRWILDVSGHRYSHAYQHATVLPPDHVDPDERIFDGQVALSFRPRRDTTLGLFVSYNGRHSSVVSRSYDGLHVGTAVVYSF